MSRLPGRRASILHNLRSMRIAPLRWYSRTALTAAVMVFAGLLTVIACRRGAPVLDPGPKPPEMNGTISGRLTGVDDSTRLVNRHLTIVSLDNGMKFTTSTTSTGGFTVKVPPGRYRVEVALRPDEHLVKAPDVVSINPSDVDANLEFVIAVGAAQHRPADSLREEDGLGAPIA
jgi:hypothetical protein